MSIYLGIYIFLIFITPKLNIQFKVKSLHLLSVDLPLTLKVHTMLSGISWYPFHIFSCHIWSQKCPMGSKCDNTHLSDLEMLALIFLLTCIWYAYTALLLQAKTLLELLDFQYQSVYTDPLPVDCSQPSASGFPLLGKRFW